MEPRRSLWRHPEFLKLWTGQAVSVFGSLISGIALPFAAVLALHATPVQMGYLSAARQVSGLTVGLAAGVWVDRLRRKPVMMVADLGRALLLFSVPLAFWLHRVSMAQLYLVALLAGGLTVFFDSAYRAYLPTLLDREQVLEGNS